MSVLLPSLVRELDIPPESQTWPASIFTLVAGAFLLPFGRLCDMYGASIVFLTSIAWLSIWTLVGGFSQSLAMLLVTRAFQGLGSAANLPAGIALLSSAYRPGPRKNFVFSLYGGCAPFGFFTGILVAGLSGEVIRWSWFFWIVSISLGTTGLVSVFCIPHDTHPCQGSMDWWGCGTSIPGIFLVVYAITESSHVGGGWGSPQIVVTFVLGILLLIGFVYIENRRAKHPLLSGSIFAPKYMVALFVYLFLVYGCFGIYLFYASF
jgi:MFS family permease